MRRIHLWKTGRGWMGAVIEDDRKLRRLVLPRPTGNAVLAGLGEKPQQPPAVTPPPAALRRAVERFFAGGDFTVDLEAAPDFGTPFQRRVWRETMRIPRGETRTYGWLAARVGRGGAARAVGQAMAANPLPLVVP